MLYSMGPGEMSRREIAGPVFSRAWALRLFMVLTSLHGKRKVECRSLSWAALRPDAAAMLFDNFPANRQANSRARILPAGVQALKDAKDALGLVRVETNTVILHGEQPDIALGAGGDVHVRGT